MQHLGTTPPKLDNHLTILSPNLQRSVKAIPNPKHTGVYNFPHKDHKFDLITIKHTQYGHKTWYSITIALSHFAPNLWSCTSLFLHLWITSFDPLASLIFESFSKTSIYSHEHPLLAIGLERLNFDLTWVCPTVTIYLTKLFNSQMPCRSIQITSNLISNWSSAAFTEISE